MHTYSLRQFKVSPLQLKDCDISWTPSHVFPVIMPNWTDWAKSSCGVTKCNAPAVREVIPIYTRADSRLSLSTLKHGIIYVKKAAENSNISVVIHTIGTMFPSNVRWLSSFDYNGSTLICAGWGPSPSWKAKTKKLHLNWIALGDWWHN